MGSGDFASLTIVADDLTGACDTGALFAGLGAVPVAVWPGGPSGGPVCVVDTESRGLGAADAAMRVAAAVGPGAHFKKIDSTLRGRIGAETDALMTATGASTVLLCPALPAQGRRVIDRVLTVDGVPVAETALAGDPEFPKPVTSSSVLDLLRPQLDRPLGWIPLAQVREDAATLQSRLRRLRGTVLVADAETDADLDRLAHAAVALSPPPLLAGSAGLAQALARRLGLVAPAPALPRGRRWLVVAASRHPATRGQVAAARAAGLAVVSAPDAEEVDRARIAAGVAASARERLARGECDAVVVAGGETAVALHAALGTERLELLGAPRPGLALARLRAAAYPDLPVVTKAGGFGAPDLLVTLLREAA
jgi:uncharacterized protein YgbK (DUF1537 family)